MAGEGAFVSGAASRILLSRSWISCAMRASWARIWANRVWSFDVLFLPWRISIWRSSSASSARRASISAAFEEAAASCAAGEAEAPPSSAERSFML